jgi:flagellar biosynthesis protein FliP
LFRNELKAAELSEEYKLDYASCIGFLIYLPQTCTDIVYAGNKLTRFLKNQEENILKPLLIYCVTSWTTIILEYAFIRTIHHEHLENNNLPRDQELIAMLD